MISIRNSLDMTRAEREKALREVLALRYGLAPETIEMEESSP